MQSDDERPASELLVVAPADLSAPLEPEMIVEGLRYLRQRIPEFTHLTWQEKRAHARAASLDPEFIESGIQAASAWHRTEMLLKRSAADLRGEQEEIRRWDQVVVEFRALADGIEAANLKRKHSLGSAILKLYQLLPGFLRDLGSEDFFMRPYYENMKRAFLKTRQFRRKKKEKPAG